MNDLKVNKESKMREVESFLQEVEKLSYEVLSTIKVKEVDYFGSRDEKPSGVSGTLGVDNGFFSKTNLTLSIIKQNLLEINNIINLF